MNIDDSLIKKLKEIYNIGDITLLTFYEFIWLEENYDICHGFLYSLINQNFYNFKMKDNFKLIKGIQNNGINRNNKKENCSKKKSENKLFKFQNNKNINKITRKICFRKTLIPKKEKRNKFLKCNSGKINNH